MVKIKRFLPWIAVGTASAAVLLMLLLTYQRRQMLNETGGDTRRIVEAAMAPILEGHPDSIQSTTFQQSVKGLSGHSHIACIWLFTAEGEIVYSSGMSPQSGPAAKSATPETRRLMNTIPQDALSPEQRTQLLIASAIQSEGEHNDVFHHLAYPIRSSGGALVGWIGVAYEVNPSLDGASWLWKFSLLAWLGCMAAYWFSLPLWVWIDARECGEKAGIWAVFVFIGNLVALFAYLLVRLPRTS